jgi:hypothetical protein
MAIDIVGPVPVINKGSTNIVVMIEYVTRYVIAIPLKANSSCSQQPQRMG